MNLLKGYLKTDAVSFAKTLSATKLKRVLAQPKLSCHEVKTRFSKEGQFLKSKMSKASLTKIFKPLPQHPIKMDTQPIFIVD